MKNDWAKCRKILCIRPDNMGDLIMSSPAIRALKKTFNCHITILTSSIASKIVNHIPEIDDVIKFDLPWVKNDIIFDANSFSILIDEIRLKSFDAAVIFTVYSQNPVPSIMIAFMARIPLRLAYCRENPYALLTDWFPEKEPYCFIKHQVQRDLDLVASIGAVDNDSKISLRVNDEDWTPLTLKLKLLGIDITKQWIIMHPGVSEAKRTFAESGWIEIADKLTKDLNCQLLFTGVKSEEELINRIVKKISQKKSFNLAGVLTLEEFVLLIKNSPLVISVNTGTTHIAAATRTPVIVLYALTNPQHAPWKSVGKIFPFKIDGILTNKNEVVDHVYRLMNKIEVHEINPEEVMLNARDLLSGVGNDPNFIIPELINLPIYFEEVL